MTTIGFSRFGGPEVLELRELPTAPPGPNQVTVRVAAAPVHPVDLVARSGRFGTMLPARDFHTPGWDAAGTVEAVGDGVTGVAPGDAVVVFNHWFDTMNGTQSTSTTVAADGVVAAPAGVGQVEASTLPLNGLTAWQSLDQLGLQPGQTLAVIGAGGAVGGFALELARERGLRAIGVGSAADEDFITGTGATFVARPDDPDLLGKSVRGALPETGDGVDGVLDAASAGAPALAAVRDGGRYVGLVAYLMPEPERGVEVLFHVVHADREQLAQLVRLAERGAVTLRVAGTYRFADVAAAHAAQEAGVRGRLVLVP